MKSKRIRAAIGALALCVLAALGLWLRMGAVEVTLDANALPAAPRADDGPIEFSVTTYNVQARPWFDDARHKFKHMSPLLSAYDICAIQECFKDHHLLWADSNHPVKVYHSALAHPFKIVGSGLSILGRFPLQAAEGMHFSESGDWQNVPASKGVLLARFLVNDLPLDVYTTHFLAGKQAASMAARVSQGNELIQFVKKHSPPEHSVIVLGDFNMRPSRGQEDKIKHQHNSRVYMFDRITAELKLQDVSDEINGPVGEEIDRILFRPGSDCELRALHWQKDAPEFYDPDGAPLSDHKPVIARFSLSNTRPPATP